MAQEQENRPEGESDDSGQADQSDEARQANYVPGSAADPNRARPTGGAYYGSVSSPEERNWSILVHLAALTSIVTSGIGGILGPLIVWLIFRGKSDMVDFHGKKALNFNISFFIYFIILFMAMIPFFIVGTIADVEQEIVDGFWETLAILVVAGLLMLVLAIIWLIWTIVAAVRASRGDPPGYILAIPFLR